MSLKNIVKEIFNAHINFQNAQQVINQAHSLDALSSDLYTDPMRFLFELIQNSDDAYKEHPMKNPLLRLAIIDENYLIVANYGKGFDERDVRGVCGVGCGTKQKDPEKTGYKGLGFKAVFGQSNYVLIASKGEYFRFEADAKEFKWNSKWGKDRITWETSNGQKFSYPWQMCPIWTEKDQLPKAIQQWLFSQPEIVASVVRVNNMPEIKRSLKTLISQAHLFIFLRRIRDIRISIDPLIETVLQVIQLRDKSIKICDKDGNLISHWLSYSCLLSVPDQALIDNRLPDKLQGIKEIDLTLAIKINQNDCFEPVKGSDSILFAYLPTKISTYNLPVLVNAQFSINASREHIRLDSSWNQWLFSCIPEEMFKWVGVLTKNQKWNNKAYDLIPNRIPIKDQLAERYNEALESNVKTVPFLIGIHRNSLLLNQAIVDLTLFSSENCLGHELIRDYFVQILSPSLRLPSNPFVHNHHRLRNLGIRQFTWDMCWQMLQSRWLLTRFKPDRAIIFINYLYEHRESNQFTKRLYDIPFLLDQDGHLRKVDEIYFPSRFSTIDWMIVEDMDTFVHPAIMDWLTNQPTIKNWLRKLGIHERTDITFIEEYLIPHVERYITSENAMITIQRLFNLFHNGSLTTRHFQDLCRLKVWTVDRCLVPANQLYFSSSYLPYLALDHQDLDQRLFLSPSYLQLVEGMSIDQWKHFFQFLGVQQTINLIQFDDRHHNELISAYINMQMSRLPTYTQLLGFKNHLTIQFLEQTQNNYQFSILFWDHVLRTINVRMLLEQDILYCQRHVLVENLPRWCVLTRPCIPTTNGQLLPSIHVFSSHLQTIIGHHLPVFACNLPILLSGLWQQFFQFKIELSVDDYLMLLERIHLQSCTTSLNDEEEQRIQMIYTILIDQIRLNNYKQKKSLSLLSTRNQQFYPSKQLVLSTDKDLNLPSIVPQLKLSDDNTRHLHIGALLDVVQVRQVTCADLSLSKQISYHPSRSLITKLRNMQPYLFALAEHHKVKIQSIDCDLIIFEADRLELVYNNEIFIHEVPVHLHGNVLYVKRPWEAEETMAILLQILCKQFRLPSNFETELNHMLKEESVSIVDQYFLEQNIFIQPHYFYPELLNIGGAREKFAAQIDRDNANLFAYLPPPSSTEELLLNALEAQNSRWSGYVYHFTHLENAVTILRQRKLKSRQQLLSDFKDSSALNVIRGTRAQVKEYVRFYFRPLTPTQRCNENLGSSELIQRFGNRPMCPIPIFFRFNLRSLLFSDKLRWKVSLGNLASPHTEFDCTPEIVKKFDFQYVYADLRTERGKYASQHELLIESELDFDLFNDNDISLFVQDENARVSLSTFLDGCRYPIHINTQYFFNYNPRVIIEHSLIVPKKISVSIYCPTKSVDDHAGELFIQIKSKTPTKTITGNLRGIYERQDAFTILGHKHVSFIPESELLQYAVYYQYEKQIWLVYTNYNNPMFHAIEE
ncbi:unnamed protein product [Adineta steineri]|uniref:DarT domain-containing protein n=1 Tax=Adineta steineri TaxID=433720 RepID=A0A815N588_9BILA|nr:unnamed protein product [Adineta steineri]